jgi:hypothetical protein
MEEQNLQANCSYQLIAPHGIKIFGYPYPHMYQLLNTYRLGSITNDYATKEYLPNEKSCVHAAVGRTKNFIVSKTNSLHVHIEQRIKESS